jgi:glycosyltransferase involved in cell wall biosynthesis
VVLVTHDATAFLEPTLASIKAQTQPAEMLIAVDDYSVDGTVELLIEEGFEVHRATTSATDATTRIAQNFHQGLRLAQRANADIVILGDHDDLWHRDRIAHQVDFLERFPHVAMLASDGYLIDAHGAAVPGTIRTSFPIPTDFNDLDKRSKLGYALRHSIATGGSSALRLRALRDWSVPAGWLHDRWWSLAAVRADRFRSDTTAVIDYRLSPDQQVGLDSADQGAPSRWLLGKARRLRTTARRVRDISTLSRR